MSNKAPIVFVSYSHDDEMHKDWVLNLVIMLRQNGVDALIDHIDLKVGEDVNRFMEQGIEKADYVLLICTDKYVEKANARKGGAGNETVICDSEVNDDQDTRKFLPINRNVRGSNKMPIYMGSRKWIDFSDQYNFEVQFKKLISSIFDEPFPAKENVGERLDYINKGVDNFSKPTASAVPDQKDFQKEIREAVRQEMEQADPKLAKRRALEAEIYRCRLELDGASPNGKKTLRALIAKALKELDDLR